MAKGKKDKQSFDSMLNVTPQQFRRWMSSQKNQFNPMISTLLNQFRGSGVEDDPMVKAYGGLVKGLPSGEQISGAYAGSAGRLAEYMRGVDTGAAGRGVSGVVGAIGGALGVEGASDIAAASNTASDSDLLNKAIMGGLTGRLAGLETSRLSDVEDQRQQLVLGEAGARSGAKKSRQDIMREIAGLRGQRGAAGMNPFDMAGMVMNYEQSRRAMGGGYGRGGTITDDTTEMTAAQRRAAQKKKADELRRMAAASASGIYGYSNSVAGGLPGINNSNVQLG